MTLGWPVMEVRREQGGPHIPQELDYYWLKRQYLRFPQGHIRVSESVAI